MIGHRFSELHGHDWAVPTLETVQQRVMHSDVESAPVPVDSQTTPRTLAGSISFGSALAAAPAIDGPLCYEGETCTGPEPQDKTTAVLDQISHIVRWDLIDNLHSVPEDCDQRAERWGWMADASVSAEGNYQYHWMGALYTSWLTSMRDVQTEPSAQCAAATGAQGDTNVVDGKAECAGAVGDLTPGQTPAKLPGDPSWMFAYPLVFSYQHRYFGDTQLARTLWPGIEAYAGFLQRMAARGKTGLISWKKYGDWLEPGKVPSLNIIGEMSSSFNFAQTLKIVGDTAASLGDATSAAKYSAAFAAAAKAFHATYWSEADATYGDGTQAALVYALYIDAVPAAHDAAVFAKLLGLIRAGTKECDSTPCLDTGIIATKWLMELLSARGRTDIGLDLAFKTDFPSWGYMAAMNATTVWEHWEYMNGPGMNSHAHPALASVGAWFFRWVAGLRLDDGIPGKATAGYGRGWRNVLFAPGCVTDHRIPNAQARITSLQGPLSASWANASGALHMNISLPPDVTARVVFPPHVGRTITELITGVEVWRNDKLLSSAARCAVRGTVDHTGSVTLDVGSGNYAFVAQQ